MFFSGLAVIVVFLLSSTISQIISRFRAKQASFTRAAFDQLRWLPFIACFFGGLSYHILTALLAHAFSVNMTWSATVKDVVDSTAPREFKLALKRFWIVWLIMFLFLATTIIMCTPLIPLVRHSFWKITLTPSDMLFAGMANQLNQHYSCSNLAWHFPVSLAG